MQFLMTWMKLKLLLSYIKNDWRSTYLNKNEEFPCRRQAKGPKRVPSEGRDEGDGTWQRPRVCLALLSKRVEIQQMVKQ